MILSCKRRTKVGHFIDDDAKGPNITLLAIPFGFALLRTHVIWTTDIRHGQLLRVFDRLGQSKVSKLGVHLFVQKNV